MMNKMVNGVIVPMTDEEEAKQINMLAEMSVSIENEKIEKLRMRRNHLLTESDWTQVSDAPVDASAWTTYRQALRDITTHSNWPNLEEGDWPTKPS